MNVGKIVGKRKERLNKEDTEKEHGEHKEESEERKVFGF
jgi:hypothetical protein